MFVSGGRKPTGLRVVEWAREAESRGAGEILLTTWIDGMRDGFDCELTAAVSRGSADSRDRKRRRGFRGALRRCLRRGKADAALAASIFHFGVTSSRELKAQLARRASGEVAMLIPSIDLIGGRIVQLVQGEKLKLAFDDFDYWIERFTKYPLVQLIDLDAAMRQGENRALIESICRRLPCQVGGGLKTAGDGRTLLDAGAKRVIYGSSLFGAEISHLSQTAVMDEAPKSKRRHKLIQLEFAEDLKRALGEDALCFSATPRMAASR